MRLQLFPLFLVASLVPAWAQAPFMTSAEVKPIMAMTQANWIAVREWEGQDLVYFTHLEAMRCGIQSVRYSINKAEPDTDWMLEVCDKSKANPNEITGEHLVYATFALKSIQSLTVTLSFDDGTSLTASYEREAVLMP